MNADLKPERFAELLNKGQYWLEFGGGDTLTVQGFNEDGEMEFIIGKEGKDFATHSLQIYEVERLIQFLQSRLENNKS